jgi:TolB-like protein/DNA-binding winged helix-turn-helix (wHTH) protein/Tfp pilus assembly protein PilF
MIDVNARPRLLRFSVFEVDLRTGELRKQGLKVKLHGQPFQVLALLLECPGELVTREEIREKLWPGDTFIDFEHSVNSSIKRLREALGDDPATPRFIETLPRHGYRFIAPVEGHPPPAPSSERRGAKGDSPPGSGGGQGVVVAGAIHESPLRRHWAVAVAGGLVAAVVAVLFALNIAGLRERVLRAVGAVREPPLQIQSIAVLPFENLSHDPGQEYFADGMTEELITNLGKISALRVISRTSVMQYKGTKKPLPQIARELNVDAIVEGTVQRSENRVRITANLLHAPTDRHLWAETYERDLPDVLALQSEVGQAIAREVQVRLTPEENARLVHARPVNPVAYELYLQGQYHYYKWRPDEFQKAIAYFQKAIEADPKWAPAYAGLADSYGWLWMEGSLPPQEVLPRFNAALRTALEIDDTLPEVRYTLAVSAFYYRWNWGEAEREFKRALALNPNLVEARYEYAWYLTSMGRFAEGLTEAKRAVERDPLSVTANLALGSMYSMARQYNQAIPQLRHTIELEPNDPRGYGFLGSAYEQMGMYEEAVTARQKAMTLSGAQPEEVASLGRAYSQSGYKGYLRWDLGRLTDPYFTAIVHTRLGHKDNAFVSLEKAYKQHHWAMNQLKVLPAWDPLRSDPRFQDLLRRMNFPP